MIFKENQLLVKFNGDGMGGKDKCAKAIMVKLVRFMLYFGNVFSRTFPKYFGEGSTKIGRF